jgi:transposase InsO family protein
VKCFRFIAAEQAHFPISLLCRVLGVSRSGFHAWRPRPPSDGDLTNAWLAAKIGEIHTESRQTYGARRVHAALAHRGVRVSRKRVERLMRTLGLSGLQPKRYRRTTIRVPASVSRTTSSSVPSSRRARTGSGARTSSTSALGRAASSSGR